MAKTNPALEHLGKVRLFQGLTPKELAVIGALAKTFTFPAGSVIVEEGAQGGRFYLITTGQADVIVHDQNVLTLREGGYFGEIALIDEGPRTATVRAVTDVEALGIAVVQLPSAAEERARRGLQDAPGGVPASSRRRPHAVGV